MDIQEFEEKIRSVLPIGTVMNNPGGGTSKIVSFSAQNIVYQRKNSKITISVNVLYKSYLAFQGQTVSSKDLRNFAPQIFDSHKGGHSCNCTFLFLVLRSLGLVQEIKGAGKAYHPFFVTINR